MKKKQIINFFLPIFVVLLIVIGIISFPEKSINSAKNGFRIWYDILIPSLLPFIICANLIVELKLVDIIGFIINPITNLLFRVSGKSALVFVISMFSGYPIGTKLASELRNKNEISKDEAQRLVSFCSTSGPLFIIGSVSTGMFLNEKLGYLMLLSHYLGALTVGIIFRNYGNSDIKNNNSSLRYVIKNSIKLKNNKSFFVLFGNSIFNALNTILMVGGFVISFSVVFEILSLFRVIDFLTNIVYIPFSFFNITKETCTAFISGIFEITIGCSKLSSITSSSEVIKVSLASFLIGFSGISILAQCCSFLANTDININMYILSKFLHGIFASIFTFILYSTSNLSKSVSTFYSNFSLIDFSYYKIYTYIILLIIIMLLMIENINIKKES